MNQLPRNAESFGAICLYAREHKTPMINILEKLYPDIEKDYLLLLEKSWNSKTILFKVEKEQYDEINNNLSKYYILNSLENIAYRKSVFNYIDRLLAK